MEPGGPHRKCATSVCWLDWLEVRYLWVGSMALGGSHRKCAARFVRFGPVGCSDGSAGWLHGTRWPPPEVRYIGLLVGLLAVGTSKRSSVLRVHWQAVSLFLVAASLLGPRGLSLPSSC